MTKKVRNHRSVTLTSITTRWSYNPRRASTDCPALMLRRLSGPEAPKSSSERSRQMCRIHEVFHGRQTAAVLRLHPIQV